MEKNIKQEEFFFLQQKLLKIWRPARGNKYFRKNIWLVEDLRTF